MDPRFGALAVLAFSHLLAVTGSRPPAAAWWSNRREKSALPRVAHTSMHCSFAGPWSESSGAVAPYKFRNCLEVRMEFQQGIA